MIKKKSSSTVSKSAPSKNKKTKAKTLKKPLSKKVSFKLDIEKMAQAGLHFGHPVSNCHPEMKSYLFGMRGTVHIIDLEQTKEKLTQALKYIYDLVSQGKKVLLVGTKIQSKNLVKQKAQQWGIPYVNERWLGGTFTNFKEIRKRVDHFKGLKEKREKGELEKYTKKERADIDQELEKMERKFGGIVDLEELPEAVIILDMNYNHLAVKEAQKTGVKIIGVCDTNADPTLADYPIPANDDAISSIEYILEKIDQAIQKAKK